jgi:ATP-binding cassette subfamily C protein LapB
LNAASHIGVLGARSRGAQSELIAASLALIILDLAIPLITLQVYNRVIPGEAVETLTMLALAGIVAIALETLLRLSRAKLISFSGFSQSHRLSRDVNLALLRADTAQVNARQDDLLNRLESVGALRDFQSGQVSITLVELLTVPLLLGVIALIAGPLVLVPLITIIGLAILIWRHTKQLETVSNERRNADAGRYNFIIEMMQSMHTIKALGMERKITRKYEALKERSTKRNFDVATSLAGIFDLSMAAGNLITFGTVIFGAYLVVQGALSAGGLIACILLAGRVTPPVRSGLFLLSRRKEYLTRKADVEDLLASKSLVPATHRGSEISTQNNGKLDLKALRFAYPDGPAVFENVSLSARKGDVISIDGAPGSGTTTLLKAIAGLHAVQSGEVLINDKPVLSFSPNELAQNVGYIRTRSTIYRGSIMDNLTRFGETRFNDVRYVARLLKLDEDVARLPSGYDTQLQGNEADPIPPGMKQRIGMVRCLALRPKLILFDNADAALDRRSYELTYQLFEQLRGSITLILCSNDSFLQDMALRRYVLSNAVLNEEGAAETGSALTPAQRLLRT